MAERKFVFDNRFKDLVASSFLVEAKSTMRKALAVLSYAVSSFSCMVFLVVSLPMAAAENRAQITTIDSALHGAGRRGLRRTLTSLALRARR